MEFTFETQYDQKALAAMARALRKTVRKRHSRRSHLFGWIVVVLGLLLTLWPQGGGFVISARVAATWIAILAILAVFLFEDALNGYVAKRRMLPGQERAATTFTIHGYQSDTQVGSSQFGYDRITAVVETPGYFVLAFSQNHGQIYDKRSLTGGTVEEFRQFIQKMTHREIQRIK